MASPKAGGWAKGADPERPRIVRLRGSSCGGTGPERGIREQRRSGDRRCGERPARDLRGGQRARCPRRTALDDGRNLGSGQGSVKNSNRANAFSGAKVARGARRSRLVERRHVSSCAFTCGSRRFAARRPAAGAQDAAEPAPRAGRRAMRALASRLLFSSVPLSRAYLIVRACQSRSAPHSAVSTPAPWPERPGRRVVPRRGRSPLAGNPCDDGRSPAEADAPPSATAIAARPSLRRARRRGLRPCNLVGHPAVKLTGSRFWS